MSGKRATPEGVYGESDPQDLRDMAKAERLQARFQWLTCRPPEYHATAGPAETGCRQKRQPGYSIRAGWPHRVPSDRWTPGNQPGKGTVTSRLRHARYVVANVTTGSPTGQRALWRQSRHSSQRTGKPATRRRAAGSPMTGKKGTRDANSQHYPWHHSEPRQQRIAAGRHVLTTLQPRVVPDSIWENLSE